MCEVCDAAVNVVVLAFLRPPEWRSKIAAYITKLKLTKADVYRALAESPISAAINLETLGL